MKNELNKEHMIISIISNFFPVAHRFCIFLIHPSGIITCIKNIPTVVILSIVKDMSSRASLNQDDTIKSYCKSLPISKRCDADVTRIFKMQEYIEQIYPDAILTFINIDTLRGKLFKYINGDEEKAITTFIYNKLKNDTIIKEDYNPIKYKIII